MYVNRVSWVEIERRSNCLRASRDYLKQLPQPASRLFWFCYPEVRSPCPGPTSTSRRSSTRGIRVKKEEPRLPRRSSATTTRADGYRSRFTNQWTSCLRL